MTNSESEIAKRICNWYERNKRPLPFRETKDAYRIWISEIMAQQTRIIALIPYYQRFILRFPTLFDLAQATEDEVLLCWQGLGYYARARNAHRAARVVCQQYGGRLPDNVKELITLPGIGAYTAGAIASIAYDKHEPAVDGNALRVFARLFAIEENVADPKTKSRVHRIIQSMMLDQRPAILTQAVMELGALICLPASPQCTDCPLKDVCTARRDNTVDELPVRSAPNAKRSEDRLILMLFSPDGSVLLRRRKEKLLHNLWEFPGFMSMESIEKHLAAWGVRFTKEPEIGQQAKHVFTHLIWLMRGVTIRADNRADIDGATWVKADSLDHFAMPAALKAYRQLVFQAAEQGASGEEAV